MATEDQGSTAAEFAELVAKLVDETFEAILDAQARQADKRTELLESAHLPDEVFVARYVDDGDIDEAAAAFVGAESIDAFVTLVSGSGNQRQAQDAIADGKAAIDALFGDDPLADDLKANVGSGVRTKVAAVFRHGAWRKRIALQLAQERRAAMLAVVDQGVPRIVVESGHITARAKFTVVSSAVSDAESEERRRERARGPVRPESLPRHLTRRGAVGRSAGPSMRILAIRPLHAENGTTSALSASAENRDSAEREIEIEFDLQFRVDK